MSVDLVRALESQLDADRYTIDQLDRYYSGRQDLSFLHPQVRAATQGRLTSLILNWPRIIVGAVEERLDVEGFRIAGEDEPIPDLWRVWQANDLDEWSGLAHVDALVHGRSFALVWYGDEPDTPSITVETSRELTVGYVPGTTRVGAALKVFDYDSAGRPERATLYLPDRVERYVSRQNVGWTLSETIGHDLGVVPVVPLVNNPRLGVPYGESELADVLPIADAVNKLATDLMVSAEYHAMPRRYATGMQLPETDAMGADAERMREVARQRWSEAEAGRVWLAGPGAEFGQFPEANLDNFVGAIRMFTEHLAAIGKLPPHYLGINTANPASADAIRSAEASLVKKAQRKTRGFGGSWERVMRLAQRVRDGVADPQLVSLETIWADVETPTVAQAADAVVKLVQAGIITPDQALEDLGYTPVQISREQGRRERAALGPVSAQLAEAQRLMREDGLSQQAAYAAVGLLQAASAIGQQPA